MVPGQRIVFRARGDFTGASAAFTGGVTGQTDGAPTVDGKLSINGENIGALVDLFAALTNQTITQRLPRRDRVEIETRITVSENQLAAEDLEIRFGDTVAKGAFSKGGEGSGRFDLKLDANRLDIDGLLAALEVPEGAAVRRDVRAVRAAA